MFLAARLPATMKRFGRDLYVERSRKVRAAHGLLQRREGFVTVVWNAGVVQWQYRSFPSFGRGFDSHRPLHIAPWASRRTITLDQRPVAMALANLVAIAATQVHASILRMATLLSRGLVFATKTFSRDTPYFLRIRTEDRKV